MKNRKYILFQIIFVTMLLVSVGLDMVTHVLTEPQTTEQTSASHSDDELSNLSDPDLFDDDPICEQPDYFLYTDQLVQKVCLTDQPVYSEFIDKSWQPPQQA